MMRSRPNLACPVLDRLAAALDSVRTAARTPANGVELSGGGHSVTLFSQ